MTSLITDDKYNLMVLKELEYCSVCPRNCHADRLSGKYGYCRCDSSFNISSITLHHGEEPVISGKNGICNVFFSHCNLQCNFCQNFQISNNLSAISCQELSLNDISRKIIKQISHGAHAVGFVSPSHQVPQMKIIVNSIRINGYSPVFVYNTNAYDKHETIRELNNIISVYLPDYKYSDHILAQKYSDASAYPEIALKAIQEMYSQTGSTLLTNEEGIAAKGLIIRHLVLPGNIKNSFGVLENIAEQVSPNVHISLMSQYYPTSKVCMVSPLNRKVRLEEYLKVVKHMEHLGMYKGWIQEPGSSQDFLPDFNKTKPFE